MTMAWTDNWRPCWDGVTSHNGYRRDEYQYYYGVDQDRNDVVINRWQQEGTYLYSHHINYRSDEQVDSSTLRVQSGPIIQPPQRCNADVAFQAFQRIPYRHNWDPSSPFFQRNNLDQALQMNPVFPRFQRNRLDPICQALQRNSLSPKILWSHREQFGSNIYNFPKEQSIPSLSSSQTTFGPSISSSHKEQSGPSTSSFYKKQSRPSISNSHKEQSELSTSHSHKEQFGSSISSSPKEQSQLSISRSQIEPSSGPSISSSHKEESGTSISISPKEQSGPSMSSSLKGANTSSFQKKQSKPSTAKEQSTPNISSSSKEQSTPNISSSMKGPNILSFQKKQSRLGTSCSSGISMSSSQKEQSVPNNSTSSKEQSTFSLQSSLNGPNIFSYPKKQSEPNTSHSSKEQSDTSISSSSKEQSGPSISSFQKKQSGPIISCSPEKSSSSNSLKEQSGLSSRKQCSLVISKTTRQCIMPTTIVHLRQTVDMKRKQRSHTSVGKRGIHQAPLSDCKGEKEQKLSQKRRYRHSSQEDSQSGSQPFVGKRRKTQVNSEEMCIDLTITEECPVNKKTFIMAPHSEATVQQSGSNLTVSSQHCPSPLRPPHLTHCCFLEYGQDKVCGDPVDPQSHRLCEYHYTLQQTVKRFLGLSSTLPPLESRGSNVKQSPKDPPAGSRLELGENQLSPLAVEGVISLNKSQMSPSQMELISPTQGVQLSLSQKMQLSPSEKVPMSSSGMELITASVSKQLLQLKCELEKLHEEWSGMIRDITSRSHSLLKQLKNKEKQLERLLKKEADLHAM